MGGQLCELNHWLKDKKQLSNELKFNYKSNVALKVVSYFLTIFAYNNETYVFLFQIL